MPSSKAYWKKRSVKDFKRRINLTEDFINTTLEGYFLQAQKDIQKDVELLYQKFADRSNISLTEAKHIISGSDLNGIDFEELSHLAMETGDAILHERLDALSRKSRITRLDALDLQIEAKLARLYDKVQRSIYEVLTESYADSYYRGIYNTQTYLGVGWDFAALNDDVITQAVTQSWHKKNFSQRIWGHRKDLSEELRSGITNGLSRGLSIDKTAKLINDKCGSGKYNATRLVRTEMNYIHNQATKKAYEEYAGIEKYRFLATLDFKTSKVCQGLDLKEFLLSEAEVGKNYPPMHPHCRSIVIPAFDGYELSSRLAKMPDGKYHTVPGNMNYEDWFRSLPVEQQREILLARQKAKNKYSDKKQLKQYKSVLGKDSPGAIAKFQELKYGNTSGWKELKKQYRAKIKTK